MLKNLFNIDINNSAKEDSSFSKKLGCEPCTLECKKINKKINGRKLTDIKDDEITNIFSPFNT